MFSLAISPQTYKVNVITIGRTAFAPVYFMNRNGKPVRFIQRIPHEGYRFVPFLDSNPHPAVVRSPWPIQHQTEEAA